MRRMLLILCVTLAIVPAMVCDQNHNHEISFRRCRKSTARAGTRLPPLSEDHELRQRRKADCGDLYEAMSVPGNLPHRLCTDEGWQRHPRSPPD